MIHKNLHCFYGNEKLKSLILQIDEVRLEGRCSRLITLILL